MNLAKRIRASSLILATFFVLVRLLVDLLLTQKHLLSAYLPGQATVESTSSPSANAFDQIISRLERTPTTLIYNSSSSSRFVEDAFNNRLCTRLLRHARTTNNSSTSFSFLLSIDSCEQLFRNSPYGTGNWLRAILTARSTAAALGINMAITCADRKDVASTLILPWMTGIYTADPAELVLINSKLQPNIQCRQLVKRLTGGTSVKPVVVLMARRLQELRYALRRMAYAVSGEVYEASDSHTNVLYGLTVYEAEQVQQTSTRLTSDDVLLHFRCGDLMVPPAHQQYGFMAFSLYRRQVEAFLKHSHKDIQSIGIITEPFEVSDSSITRTVETGYLSRQRCKLVVTALRNYLRLHFGDTISIVIRNKDVSLAQSYARWVRARYSFGTTVSTFGVFAALASEGHLVRLYRPAGVGLGTWIGQWREQATRSDFVPWPSTVELIESTKAQTKQDWLPSRACLEMWGADTSSSNTTAVLQWFLTAR